jgi:hypothetical protein
LRPGVAVDADFFTRGIRLSTDQSVTQIDWTLVQSISAIDKSLEIDCESYAIHIPERAFASRAAFLDAGNQIRHVWREAVKRDRDGRMIAAGLD